MKKMMKVCGVFLVVTLAGSACMAQRRGDDRHDSRGNFGNDNRGDFRHDYRGHDDGRHYGYYRNSHGDLFFGLLGIGMAAAIVSSIDRPVYYEDPVRVVYPTVVQQPAVVYVQQPPVVVQQPEPKVIYVQQPEVVQPPVVVQQTVPVEDAPPVTVTVNVQNTNGSFTPVTLRKAGTVWIGPKGEYYRDGVPSVGQLRPLYGL